MKTKKVTSFRVVFHGVDNEQYFQGHGISFTDYDESATGSDMNARGAVDWAIDSLAQNGVDFTDSQVAEIFAMADACKHPSVYTLQDQAQDKGEEFSDEGLYFYASIDVKTKASES